MCSHQNFDETGESSELVDGLSVDWHTDSQTVFLPIIGLVPHEELRPGDLIGVNKDSYLILDKLPAGMPVWKSTAMCITDRQNMTPESRRWRSMSDLPRRIPISVDWISRSRSWSRQCDLILQETGTQLTDSVLPMQQADKFKTLGITPPKGCLMYGPPG